MSDTVKKLRFKEGDRVILVNPLAGSANFKGERTIVKVLAKGGVFDSGVFDYQIGDYNYRESELEPAGNIEKGVAGVGADAPTVTNARGGLQSKVNYRLDLVEAKALLEMGKVLDEGAVKYGEWNWLKIDTNDHLNHALIHIYAYLAGDKQDDHLAHAAVRAQFALSTYLKAKEDEQDVSS